MGSDSGSSSARASSSHSCSSARGQPGRWTSPFARVSSTRFSSSQAVRWSLGSSSRALGQRPPLRSLRRHHLRRAGSLFPPGEQVRERGHVTAKRLAVFRSLVTGYSLLAFVVFFLLDTGHKGSPRSRGGDCTRMWIPGDKDLWVAFEKSA